MSSSPGHACCVAPFRKTVSSHSASPPYQLINGFQDKVSAMLSGQMITGSLRKGPIMVLALE